MNDARAMAVAACIGETLYVCGGNGPSGERLRSAECLCTSLHEGQRADTWEPIEPMMEQHSAAASGVLNSTLYVCGGFNGLQWLSSVEEFDPARGSWTQITPMLTPRAGAAAAVVQKQLYVCGGWGNGDLLGSVEEFCPGRSTVNKWQYVPGLAFGCCDASAVSFNGKLFLLGGDTSTGTHQQPSRNARAYDPSCMQWSVVRPMYECRLSAAAAFLPT